MHSSSEKIPNYITPALRHLLNSHFSSGDTLGFIPNVKSKYIQVLEHLSFVFCFCSPGKIATHFKLGRLKSVRCIYSKTAGLGGMLTIQCSLGIQQKLHMLGTYQNLIFLKEAALYIVFKWMRKNSWNQMCHNSPPLPVRYISRNKYQTMNFFLTPHLIKNPSK